MGRLHDAASSGNLAVVRQLVREGYPVNERGQVVRVGSKNIP
jgi:hypothetical protein